MILESAHLRKGHTMIATALAERPPFRVRHTWRCHREGPYAEQTRTLAHGRILVVIACAECGGSDLTDRVHAERRRP
jgi:hypothetical protein